MLLFFLGIYLEVELWVHTVTPDLTFCGTLRLFFKMDSSFYTSPIMGEGSNFSKSFPEIIIGL
jgi:hypothetical protein